MWSQGDCKERQLDEKKHLSITIKNKKYNKNLNTHNKTKTMRVLPEHTDNETETTVWPILWITQQSKGLKASINKMDQCDQTHLSSACLALQLSHEKNPHPSRSLVKLTLTRYYSLLNDLCSHFWVLLKKNLYVLNANLKIRTAMRKKNDAWASTSFHLQGKNSIDYIFTKQFQDNQSFDYKTSSININATAHNQ